jgi:ATP-binding cassette, subfamily B (MDR/TAP), member 1
MIYNTISLHHIAAGGSLAEEVISTVRTARAFGAQSILSRVYNKHVDSALDADMKAAAFQGSGVATFFFVLYSAYALGL